MLLIKKAALEDKNAIFKLNKKFNGEGNTLQNIEESLKYNKNEIILIAYEDDKAVGFVCGQISKSICYLEKQGIITGLFVKKKYRRKGIAKKLLMSIERVFANNNICAVTLETSKKNEKAQSLYKKSGYKRNKHYFYYKDL